MPTQLGNKHFFINFFPHGFCTSHLSTEGGRAKSSGNRHQNPYCQADVVFEIYEMISRKFFKLGKYIYLRVNHQDNEEKLF